MTDSPFKTPQDQLRSYVELHGALQLIRDEEGKVCDEYEICGHKACESSYRAWVIADTALRR